MKALLHGYSLGAQDGKIGSCQDFLSDDQKWAICYVVADTRNWISGSKRVIIVPNWVDSIDCSGRALKVRMTRERIESNPEYDPTVP